MYIASHSERPSLLAENADSPTIYMLPPVRTIRWVIRRKAQVLSGIRAGIITRQEALERYRLSDEELDSWQFAADVAGVYALRTTRLQAYRPLLDQFRNGNSGDSNVSVVAP